MSNSGQSGYGILDRSNRRRAWTGRVAFSRLLVAATPAALIAAGGSAHGGPCTEQIAQLEEQIVAAAPAQDIGPTAPQTLGAQLHHQPTPASVGQAERVANADADAALARAKSADANGNASGCSDALTEARHLYGL